VIVVEEPFVGPDERDEIVRDGGVTIVRPIRRERPAGALIDARAIATARELLGEARAPAVWLYTPMMNELADAFPGAPLIFDCMDDLAAFALAPPEMAERERALLERADVVFAGGRSLYERRAGYGGKVHCEPSGVEYERFAAASVLAAHPVVAAVARPRYGYIGVIDERIDVGIIERLADAQPVVNVFMIGPIVKIDPAILPRRTNVHFTGSVPYAELPAMLAGLDAALMPFADNESTRSISPTKTLEYLAAGVPVVSTAVTDVVREHGDIVTIAEAGDFVAACARAARAASDADRDRMRARAHPHGWDAIADRMWTTIQGLR
jgi:glycosyltransferase involved in cell wall biosynthesis